jgi:hypothetical protein
MNYLRSVLIATSALLMATAAQAQQTRVQANVPFDFVVGDRAYPAGEYSLKSVLDSGTVLRIENMQEVAGANVSSITCTSLMRPETTKLVFRRMGDYYFLYQVWTAGNLSGREFPRSRTEVQLAQNNVKSDIVIVAANISH